MIQANQFWAVSDVHIHPEHPDRTALFLSFLRKVSDECSLLLILGDLFDYWVGPVSFHWEAYYEVLQALKQLREQGMKVAFVGGNRDFLAVDDLQHVFGQHTFPYQISIQQNIQNWCALHGDTLCHFDTNYHAFRRFLRDTEAAQTIKNVMPNRFKHRLVKSLRAASKWDLERKDEARMAISRYRCEGLFSQGYDCLVFGHIHRKAHKKCQVGGLSKQIFSLGDWTLPDGGTYLTVNEDGESFRQFSG